MNFDKAIAAAAAASPMGKGSVPILPNRILVADGDGLAYYCAGNDSTEPGEARANLIAKLESARRISGCGDVSILITPSGSVKGHRYAIATVKPYQGQRKGDRRPKNWQYLRDLLDSGSIGGYRVSYTQDAEADDLFAMYSTDPYVLPVYYTQDKDMRMLPGTHLDWVSHRQHTVRDEYASIFNDKLYGRSWFWHQMLHGDTADNIPGLPFYWDGPPTGGAKQKKVGEVTAGKILAGCVNESAALAVVRALYANCYGPGWLVHMLEQACLLWLQRVPGKWDDCCDFGGPMHPLIEAPDFAGAHTTIKERVENARRLNSAAAA